MATKSQVLREAKRHGFHIVDDGFAIDAIAPDGYVLAGMDIHYVSRDYARYGGPKSEVWQAIMDDIVHGIEFCPQDDCEYCTGV